jgi:sugar phosphate isomerase/epimerase
MEITRRAAVLSMMALTGCQSMTNIPTAATKRQFALGLQLYTLGDAPQKDLAGTLTKVAALGYTDIELPGLMGYTAADIRAAADAQNLKISSIHVMPSPLSPAPALTLQSGYSAVADAAQVLGASHVVMPLMVLPDMSAFTGDNFAMP